MEQSLPKVYVGIASLLAKCLWRHLAAEGVSTLWGLHPGKLLSRITTNDAWDSDPLTHAGWLFHCYTFRRTFCLVVGGVSRGGSSVVAKLQGYLMSPKLCWGFRLVSEERMIFSVFFVEEMVPFSS